MGGQGLGGSVVQAALFPQKFLWEELELVREEVMISVYQKLRQFQEPTDRRGVLVLLRPP